MSDITEIVLLAESCVSVITVCYVIHTPSFVIFSQIISVEDNSCCRCCFLCVLLGFFVVVFVSEHERKMRNYNTLPAKSHGSNVNRNCTKSLAWFGKVLRRSGTV